MNKQHFYPERTLKIHGGHQFTSQYEGVKATHEADLSAVEKCFGKCSIALSEAELNQQETGCLRQCYLKYFDSALLVQKELLLYTHQLPVGL